MNGEILSADLGGSAESPILEADHCLPLVHWSLAAHTGAALDPVGLEGLTRLSARLARRTAGGRPPADNEALLDRLGASVGVEAGHAAASIVGSCLSRSLPQVVTFLTDMLRAGMDEVEFERLRRESIAELSELLDSDEHLAQQAFARSLFEGHPYGRSPVGTLASLERMTRLDARAAVERHFRAGNVTLSFAGDLDSATASRVTQQLGAALPAPSAGPDASAHGVLAEPEAPPRGRRLVYVDKPERTQNQVIMGCLGTHPRDEDHIAMVVGNTLFGGTFSARLTHEIRSKRGWSYGASSAVSFERFRQSFSMWTFPSADDAAACIGVELAMVDALVEQGATSDELAWAKRYLIQSHAFAIDTAPKRVGLALEQRLWDLPRGYFAEFRDRVAAVSLEDVNRALRRRISPERWLIVVVGTHADNGAKVERAVPGLVDCQVLPYDGLG